MQAVLCKPIYMTASSVLRKLAYQQSSLIAGWLTSTFYILLAHGLECRGPVRRTKTTKKEDSRLLQSKLVLLII